MSKIERPEWMDDPVKVDTFVRLSNGVIYSEAVVDTSREAWAKSVEHVRVAEEHVADMTAKLIKAEEHLEDAKDELAVFLWNCGQEETTG